MRVQRYIKYLKPPNKKCLISGILVFLCKSAGMEERERTQKRDPEGSLRRKWLTMTSLLRNSYNCRTSSSPQGLKILGGPN